MNDAPTFAEQWLCPACHRPMGYVAKLEGRKILHLYNGVGIIPLAEIEGNATVHCPWEGCAGERKWHFVRKSTLRVRKRIDN